MKPKRVKKSVQQMLAFGQKEFKTCNVCGMTYSVNLASDLELHRNYHSGVTSSNPSQPSVDQSTWRVAKMDKAEFSKFLKVAKIKPVPKPLLASLITGFVIFTSSDKKTVAAIGIGPKHQAKYVRVTRHFDRSIDVRDYDRACPTEVHVVEFLWISPGLEFQGLSKLMLDWITANTDLGPLAFHSQDLTDVVHSYYTSDCSRDDVIGVEFLVVV